ncbi:MAG: hypothetical protein ACQEXO_10415 [Pseudomonadota bacterium]
MDEREKLRQFRELDDAFAQALRKLDGPDDALGTSNAPPLIPATPVQEENPPGAEYFEPRLRELMQEYHQTVDQVADLLETLRSLGRIA